MLDDVGDPRVLAQLMPDVRHTELVLQTPAGWSRFNPSLWRDDGGFRTIVRSSNYELFEPGYAIYDDDSITRTRNYLVRLRNDLSVVQIEPIEDATDTPPALPGRSLGFEDCRLFRWNGEWFATATMRDRNSSAVAQIGVMRLVGNVFTELRLLSDPRTKRDEKNWMPIVTASGIHLVYGCGPTIVLRYDPCSGRVEEVAHWEAPAVATPLHGGSQAVEVDGSYLFVVHEAIQTYGGLWWYPHRFVRLDSRFRLTGISRRFYFQRPGVEFCAGLVLRGSELIASYGVQDRSAWFASLPLQSVMNFLEPVDHGEMKRRNGKVDLIDPSFSIPMLATG